MTCPYETSCWCQPWLKNMCWLYLFSLLQLQSHWAKCKWPPFWNSSQLKSSLQWDDWDAPEKGESDLKLKESNVYLRNNENLFDLQEVDFGVGHFSVVEERQMVVDFTPAFLIDHYIILLRKPDLSQSQIFICFGPFTNEVWVYVAASVICTYTLINYLFGKAFMHVTPHINITKCP